MPGKEREGLTHFMVGGDVGRRLREAAEHAKEAAAEVEEAAAEMEKVVGQVASSEPPEVPAQAPSSEPPVEVVTGKFLSAGLAEFITTTSMTANAFVRSSAAEIGELIGKELEATEAAEPRRDSTVSKSE